MGAKGTAHALKPHRNGGFANPLRIEHGIVVAVGGKEVIAVASHNRVLSEHRGNRIQRLTCREHTALGALQGFNHPMHTNFDMR